MSDAGTKLARVVEDRRGAVMTEYVVLIGAVAIIVSSAIAAAGYSVISKFETARFILMLPIP